MNLHRLLLQRAADRQPLRVALIGAGKFGSMFLSQVRRTPGLHLVAVCDLAPPRARESLQRVGWPAGQYAAASLAAAHKDGTTFVTDDALAVIRSDAIEIAIDATGNPAAGIRHALACCEHGKHIVMVNVEADALAGPLLAQRARDAGIVYSLAYGDQPALICELVDWCRTAGFEVVAAGKGTRHLPAFERSTPATVWGHYGIDPGRAREARFNAQMFNSFLDGTKSALEMAAVANATGLDAPADGLAFPPAGVGELATLLRPAADGGVLEQSGMVEVVSSLQRDGSEVADDLRWGVYVVVRAADAWVAARFADYGVRTDASGHYAALYRPLHLIGLELGVSVASVALRGEPTGAPRAFRADVAAVAKRDLAAGERLDGEGGATVRGKLLPAATSLRVGALPIGLAAGVPLRRRVPADGVVRWDDV
ncbi:MAG TPA: Gfo/Idh/MocA family oxidoreductase, partial [Burkholderiales bacterium]|nr:Gfo/Idh/MocA family oxidoreductase [Burkholderiales bacterium]